MKKTIWVVETRLPGTPTACTREGASRSALEAAGFTDISLTGWAAFQCGEDDTFSTGFEATNTTGNRATGTVCCGVFKGCTIRY